MQKLRAATIEQKRVIPAKPAEVYRVIADPEIHSAFTGARATGRARKGAKFTAWDGYIMGKTLIAELGERLVQEWWTTGWPEDSTPSCLEWKFKKHPRGTLASLKQTGVPESQAKYYRKGWIEFYWRPLRAYFAAKI